MKKPETYMDDPYSVQPHPTLADWCDLSDPDIRDIWRQIHQLNGAKRTSQDPLTNKAILKSRTDAAEQMMRSLEIALLRQGVLYACHGTPWGIQQSNN